uniref:Uncharacterized protein n=1 Tax=Arundo donax TaxID=35708 RepID=A0A0A9E5J4_ARUDO
MLPNSVGSTTCSKRHLPPRRSRCGAAPTSFRTEDSPPKPLWHLSSRLPPSPLSLSPIPHLPRFHRPLPPPRPTLRSRRGYPGTQPVSLSLQCLPAQPHPTPSTPCAVPSSTSEGGDPVRESSLVFLRRIAPQPPHLLHV